MWKMKIIHCYKLLCIAMYRNVEVSLYKGLTHGFCIVNKMILGCNEAVIWTILADPLIVSSEQVHLILLVLSYLSPTHKICEQKFANSLNFKDTFIYKIS